MGAGGRRAAALSVGGLGVADVGLRAGPDVVGAGEGIVVPALIGLTASGVVSYPAAGAVVGVLMLVVPVVYLAPALFPRAFLTSRHNLVVRGFVGASALVVALYAREAILVVVTGTPGTLPLATSAGAAASVLAAVVAGLAVLLLVPWDRFGSAPARAWAAGESRSGSDTSTRPEADDEDDEDDDGDTPAPWGRSIDDLHPPLGLLPTATLLVVGVGVVLATVSLLYPVPELLGIVAGVYVAASPGQEQTRDVVEPLILAVRSVWDGVGGATVFVYAVVVLYYLSLAGAEGIVSTFDRVGPAGAVVYATAAFVPIVYAVKYVERSYRSVLTRGAVRVPLGVMAPVGLLSGLQIGVQRAGAGSEATDVVAAWTTPVWALAVVGAAVTALLSFSPGGRGWVLPVAAAALDRDEDANPSAPTVAIPTGVVGLIVAQGVTRDLVAYHLSSAMTLVGTASRLVVAVVVAVLVAGVVLAVPYVTVFLLSVLFGLLSEVAPWPLDRLLGS